MNRFPSDTFDNQLFTGYGEDVPQKEAWGGTAENRPAASVFGVSNFDKEASSKHRSNENLLKDDKLLSPLGDWAEKTPRKPHSQHVVLHSTPTSKAGHRKKRQPWTEEVSSGRRRQLLL